MLCDIIRTGYIDLPAGVEGETVSVLFDGCHQFRCKSDVYTSPAQMDILTDNMGQITIIHLLLGQDYA